MLLAATVRVAAYLAAPPVALIGDEIYYSQVAGNLERGLGHVFHESDAGALRAWRPPGMAFALAGVLTEKPVALGVLKFPVGLAAKGAFLLLMIFLDPINRSAQGIQYKFIDLIHCRRHFF